MYTCMRFCQSRLILVVVRVRVCVYLTDMRVERGKQGRRERDGEMLCANPYSRWRIQGHSFMFCQPSVNQFPIKVVLNSAVIPISLLRFCFTTTTAPPLTVSEVLKHFPCLLSDLLQCVQHALPGQTRAVKFFNNTS